MTGPHVLLALWERAIGLPPKRRDDVLLQALTADEQSPPTALATRNRGLLELHAALFGPRLALHSRCPACAHEIEFECDVSMLTAAAAAPSPAATYRLRHERHALCFRLPDAENLDEAARAADEDGFVERLLEHCVLSCEKDGAHVPPGALPSNVRSALSERMESLDPGASLGFDLHCPDCGRGWHAPFDVGAVLWQRLQAAAERLLLEVDRLARRYGWSEAEVLALSPMRRAAYLQLGTA